MSGFPLRFRHTILDGSRPYVVAILNVTPDSFSDGGKHFAVEVALERAREMAEEGADIIDIGGESTRPGAEPVGSKEELRRVLPVIESLARTVRVPLSVDTYKAEVAEAALGAGAEIVNDISGGELDAGLFGVVNRAHATLVLGHLRGRPATMQTEIQFTDVYEEVREELAVRIERAAKFGVRQIIVDPGIGFGKGKAHNLELLGRVGELSEALSRPIMIGASRKSFLGELTRTAAPEERLAPSLAAAVLAAERGAHFLRVHDVAETKIALEVVQALRQNRPRLETTT